MVEQKDKLLDSILDTSWGASQEGLKLNLGCGTVSRPGYIGVDSASLEDIVKGSIGYEGEEKILPTEETYIQHDLFDMPWPWEDGEVAATYAAHLVEHIPHYHPNWGIEKDGWWVFFEELYRILEDGGIAEFIHPFSRSDRAFFDPTHTRYIHYQTWFYLNREWRIANGVNHEAPDIDFEVLGIQAVHEPMMLQGRSAEVIDFARQFYFNPTDDLFVVLRANK